MAGELSNNGSVSKKPIIHFHEPSRLRYLRGQKKIIFENGALIDRDDFEKRLGVDLNDYLSTVPDRDYSFNYACTTGKIRKMWGHGTGRKVKPVISDISEPVPELPSVPAVITDAAIEPADTISKPQLPSVLSILTGVILLIGLGCAVMSGFHTTTFLSSSGKPFWVSLCTGVIMILFSTTAFTLARTFLTNKNAGAVFGIVFILLGLGVVSYSMFSTVTVNFNQFQWEEQKEVTELIENSAELAIADETRAAMLMEVERLDREIERLQKEAEGWRNQSWARYDEYVQRIDEITLQRSRAWDNYLSAGTSRITAESRIEASRLSIYSFVARLFGISEELLRFLVYVIPSVFYDIAAPFALSAVLILIERRKDA